MINNDLKMAAEHGKEWRTNDICLASVINGDRVANCSSGMSSEEAFTTREINFRRLPNTRHFIFTEPFHFL